MNHLSDYIAFLCIRLVVVPQENACPQQVPPGVDNKYFQVGVAHEVLHKDLLLERVLYLHWPSPLAAVSLCLEGVDQAHADFHDDVVAATSVQFDGDGGAQRPRSYCKSLFCYSGDKDFRSSTEE